MNFWIKSFERAVGGGSFPIKIVACSEKNCKIILRQSRREYSGEYDTPNVPCSNWWLATVQWKDRDELWSCCHLLLPHLLLLLLLSCQGWENADLALGNKYIQKMPSSPVSLNIPKMKINTWFTCVIQKLVDDVSPIWLYPLRQVYSFKYRDSKKEKCHLRWT